MTALFWPRLLKAAPLIALGLLLAAMIVKVRVVVVERDAARGERDVLVKAVTDATVEPDAKGARRPLTVAEAATAVPALARDRDDARGALATIGRRTTEARARDVQADKALATAQAGNARTFARETAPRVAAVAAVRPTGEPARDAAALDNVLAEAWR